MLHKLTYEILPPIISVFELIGILVVSIGGVKAFYHYVLNDLLKKEKISYRPAFLSALSLGLEFKLSSEILKTVLITDINELFVLGAVIALRAGMAVMVRWDMRHEQAE